MVATKTPTKTEEEQEAGSDNSVGDKAVIVVKYDEPGGSAAIPSGWVLLKTFSPPLTPRLRFPATLKVFVSLWGGGGEGRRLLLRTSLGFARPRAVSRRGGGRA